MVLLMGVITEETSTKHSVPSSSERILPKVIIFAVLLDFFFQKKLSALSFVAVSF